MITETDINLRSVALLTNERNLTQIKSLINVLKEKHANFSIFKFRTGKIGEDILVSFKIKNTFYTQVLEIFAYNDVNVITKDKTVSNFIQNKKDNKKKKLRSQGWQEISSRNRRVTMKELEVFSQQGKINEIVKEAKGHMDSNIENVKKAKSLLSKTILCAIDNLITHGNRSEIKRQSSIDELILIATDKSLKLFHKQDEMKKAGDEAIMLSLFQNEYCPNLIKIANNTNINNQINIKAALLISELYNNADDKKLFMKDIVRQLNTRWLKIALETIEKKLTVKEVENLIRFIDVVNLERKAN